MENLTHIPTVKSKPEYCWLPIYDDNLQNVLDKKI